MNLSFTLLNADWSGTYLAQIRRKALGSDSPLLGTLTVTATLAGADTEFVLSMSAGNSAAIPVGTWSWDLQQVGGVTRLKGLVNVLGQASV